MWVNLAKGVLAGVIGAAATSVVLSLLVQMFHGFVRQPAESAPWLFAVSVVPSALGGGVLAAWSARSPRSPGRTWVLSAVVAYGVVALAGSLGAIAVESARRGLERVNVGSYFAWCWVYALVLLPITVPLARGIERTLCRQNS
jgi:hypothetical protein